MPPLTLAGSRDSLSRWMEALGLGPGESSCSPGARLPSWLCCSYRTISDGHFWDLLELERSQVSLQGARQHLSVFALGGGVLPAQKSVFFSPAVCRFIFGAGWFPARLAARRKTWVKQGRVCASRCRRGRTSFNSECLLQAAAFTVVSETASSPGAGVCGGYVTRERRESSGVVLLDAFSWISWGRLPLVIENPWYLW